MRVVSIGDLVTDYYYKNEKLLGINGGMSSHNIVANLSKMGIETAVYGSCGNDDAGLISIKSLEDLKVDVSKIKIIDNIKTRCFHISYFDKENGYSFTSKKRCPFCNNKKWYEESMIESKAIVKQIHKDDILVFDNLNNQNQEIIDSTTNKKIIDLGQYFEFENLSDEEIIKKIENKFEIINFNERVSNYIKKRLCLKENIDLFKKLSPKLMTITKGEKGAEFIYNNEVFRYELKTKENAVDPTGAGDAFISSIIKDWIKNEFKLESDKFAIWYKNATKLTSKVVKKIGARGHLRCLYKTKKIDNYCTCERFILHTRKQIKRCNININSLQTRINNTLKSNALSKLEIINFNENDNYLFIGTGGSFAAAYFASTIINQLYGCNTYAMYPRNVIYRNNKNIDKAILFSYSGTTNDIMNSVCNIDDSNKYMITKGQVQNIALKTRLKKENIISYRTPSNNGKERGFLSFEGVIAPSILFLKFYYNKVNPNFDIELFISNVFEYWHNYFEILFKDKKKIELLQSCNIVNIFCGDYTNSACYDLESKIIESGILNCIIHEKKNFSHGRFINYENLNNKSSIFFKQQSTSKYEEKLLEYLGEENTVIIESKYDGILCEFDLLVASQLLIYYIGNKLDIDVSKPNYSEDAMKIYFYKGEL